MMPIKIIGVIMNVENTKMHVNLATPLFFDESCSSKTDSSRMEKKISNLDTLMMQKLNKIKYPETITSIKIYKPFYRNKRNNMIVILLLMCATRFLVH